MPPLAGRMAKQGEEEHNASYGRRTRRSVLRAKLLGDWESLEFMRDFWNPEYDERDILQYRRLVPVWRMRESGASYKALRRKRVPTNELNEQISLQMDLHRG